MHVYVITNTVNGKIYVGQHSGENLHKYFIHKTSRGNQPKYSKSALHSAIRKYGRDNFTIESLANPSTKEEMDRLEILFIDILNSKHRDIGYNLTDGGEGVSGITFEHTDEWKQNMSTLMKGRVLTPEWKEKIAAAQRGRKLSPEHIAALRIGQTGKKKSRSLEHSEKIRANKLEWWRLKKEAAQCQTI